MSGGRGAVGGGGRVGGGAVGVVVVVGGGGVTVQAMHHTMLIPSGARVRCIRARSATEDNIIVLGKAGTLDPIYGQ